MKSSKTIVFINPGQFGYKAGYYYYSKYLKAEGFTIKFLCFDQGYPKIELEGVEIMYVPFSDNKVKRTLQWHRAVYECINTNSSNGTIFFINYFKFCAIFGVLFTKSNKILDIRTGSISPNFLKNYFQNFFIRQTTKVYNHVTILSEGLIDLLKLKRKKCHLLPLGSEAFSTRNKSYDVLRLLYVGTLNKRRIHETVEGLAIFLKSQESKNIKVIYDIFGTGNKNDELKLRQAISDLKLEGIVHYHGRKRHEELKPYFDKCNVGISYVPMTDFFEYQPPTKTFEYILSGMVCIATDTYENRKLISKENGVLCVDTPESFCSSIQKVVMNNKQYTSQEIRRSLNQFLWQNIIKRNLKPYLNKLDSFQSI